MRPQDNFNIITGQVKQPLTTTCINRRFASLNVIKNGLLSGSYEYALPQKKKLGKMKDDKAFHYTYADNDPAVQGVYKRRSTVQRKPADNDNPQPAGSLINATRLGYNIINNTVHPGSIANRNWSNTKRTNPVSRFTHHGRTNAPNYTMGYGEKLMQSKSEYCRKKNICGQVCQIQKNSTQRYFRKYK